MCANLLKKAPGHSLQPYDIYYWYLWKPMCKKYYKKILEEWIRPYRCPLASQFKCKVSIPNSSRKGLQATWFLGEHNEAWLSTVTTMMEGRDWNIHILWSIMTQWWWHPISRLWCFIATLKGTVSKNTSVQVCFVVFSIVWEPRGSRLWCKI